jgi:hypothetical protein
MFCRSETSAPPFLTFPRKGGRDSSMKGFFY